MSTIGQLTTVNAAKALEQIWATIPPEHIVEVTVDQPPVVSNIGPGGYVNYEPGTRTTLTIVWDTEHHNP